MRGYLVIGLWCLAAVCGCPSLSTADQLRIKDISRVQGARRNQLVGYGLILGLQGTGDSAQVSFTTQAVRNLVTSFGTLTDSKIKTKNAATAIVTAELPPFAKPGERIDVTVSSLGDARSLQGGMLLQTPLQGADGKVYAVAQGPVSIGGYAAGGGGAQTSKNHPTVGRVPEGALVELAVPTDVLVGDTLSLSLHYADYATSVAVAEAINRAVGGAPAAAEDAGTILVVVPEHYQGRTTEFLAILGELTVHVDIPARVVINERTGTIVVGGPVAISPVAVAHGSLTVTVQSVPLVSQPPPLSTGETVTTQETTVTAEEQSSTLKTIEGATVNDLVLALNALQASPRDLIAILQAVKEAGALHAALEVL